MRELHGRMTGRKKIAIVYSAPLYPLNSMNKVRIINQIKGLSPVHDVDLLFLHVRESEASETSRLTHDLCRRVIPVKTLTQTAAFRIVKKLVLGKLFEMCNYPLDYFIPSNPVTSKAIASIIDREGYDVVISHYWQGSGFMKYLSKPVYKCLDAHYVVEENLKNLEDGGYDHIDKGSLKKLLLRELCLQNRYFDLSDMIIVNSPGSGTLIAGSSRAKNIMVVPNGQDLEYFLNYPMVNNDRSARNILFYGSLSSQFNVRALKRILQYILPGIRMKVPGVRLIILGANPPSWLDSYRNHEEIIITGYREDIRPVLAESTLTLIPLESGSGFRGRTIELMAMGVPVIGTHNALDCLEMEHGVHGFVVDQDSEIISTAVELLENSSKREEVSRNAMNFIKERYTIEATFGLLSKHFSEI